MTPSELPWLTPRRTHVGSPWVGLWSVSRGGIGLVVFAVAIGRPLLIIVAVVLTVASSLVTWLRRTWSFDGSTITLDDGLLHRTFRRVPVGRVQQVEVNEPLLHRLVGLAVVRIETAGGAGQSEVRLDALAAAEARALRAAVLGARSRALAARPDASSGMDDDGDGPARAHDSPPPPPPPEQLVLRLSMGRVMLSGITSSTLLVVLVVVSAGFDAVSRLPRSVAESVEDQATTVIESLGLLAGLGALTAVAVVAAALSAVTAHHDLTVVRSGDELRLRRGLFERRDAVVPLARVQAIAIRQNPAQRLLGLSSVQVRSAGTGLDADDRLLIPLANRHEIDGLIRAAIGWAVPLDDLIAAPPAARSRRVVRRIALATLAVGGAALVPDRPAALLPVMAVALLAIAVGLGLDAYANLGHRDQGEVVVTRWGSLLRRTVVVSVPRVQSVRVQASAFQRARGIATLSVDLAGRGINPVVIDQTATRCIELDEALRASPVALDPRSRVSSPEASYATMGPRLTPSPNEES